MDGTVGAAVDLLQYGPDEGVEGRGDVFLTNPIVATGNPDLRDEDDSADAVPAEVYARVTLRGLDGTGILSGSFVTTAPTPNVVRRSRSEKAGPTGSPRHT